MRRKILNTISLVCFVFVVLFNFSFAGPASAAGATLYITPSTGTQVIGTNFNVSIKVNSGGQVINAAEGGISFDKSLLEVVSISKGGAVFNLWTLEPSFSNSAGTISFGGGIPRPGYNGTAGHVCTVTFKAKNTGVAQISFTSGAVLANDGKGTNILASMGSGSYTISPKVTAPKTSDTSDKVDTKQQATETKKVEVETEYNTPVIISETHPKEDSWYKNNKLIVRWDLPKGVTDISFLLDKNPNTVPGNVSDGLTGEKEFADVEDGVNYFHLKFKDSKKWGTADHYKIMIDTKAPLDFEITLKQSEKGVWPVLQFETKDEGSGMDKYEVVVGSLESEPHVLTADKKEFETTDLSVGEHMAMVKAFDKAGNIRIAEINFTIDPIEAPIILNYPLEMKSSDKFYINGTAISESVVSLFIEKDGQVVAKASTTTDKKGNWFLIFEKDFVNGRYVAWAEAKNSLGIPSSPSNKISFLVSPPIFTKIGNFVVNYFTVLVSLIFMIILIIILILYLMGILRRKLKKETVEIEEVLHKNLEEYKKSAEKEFARLKKYEGKTTYGKEKIKTKKALVDNIDEVEKNILKEIRDVEEILK